MRKNIFISLIVMNLFLLGTAIYGKEIKNFYKVSEEVYRSAQPDRKDMKKIENMGIKTVLSLREYNDDKDEAKDTKLILKHVKMNAGKIKDKEIIEALKIIKNSDKPILVHCWHGSDRTGVVVAMYRIVFQNVSKEKAIEELKDKKYGYHAAIYGNIEKYIRESNIENIRIELEK